MNRYEVIVEALQDMVDNDYITFEDAEIINNLAYNKYVIEDGHSKKLKARHKEQKRNITKRFYDNMGYKQTGVDELGNKHGTVQRGDGPETKITIYSGRKYKNLPEDKKPNGGIESDEYDLDKIKASPCIGSINDYGPYGIHMTKNMLK